MNHGLTTTGAALLDRISQGIQKHPKRITALVAAFLLTGGGGAFAVASLAPDPADLPVRMIEQSIDSLASGTTLAALTEQPIRYAYPTFGGTRDEKAVEIMRQRINAFGLLLGGVPPLDADTDAREQSFAEAVLRCARKDLESLNRNWLSVQTQP